MAGAFKAWLADVAGCMAGWVAGGWVAGGWLAGWLADPFGSLVAVHVLTSYSHQEKNELTPAQIGRAGGDETFYLIFLTQWYGLGYRIK